MRVPHPEELRGYWAASFNPYIKTRQNKRLLNIAVYDDTVIIIAYDSVSSSFRLGNDPKRNSSKKIKRL